MGRWASKGLYGHPRPLPSDSQPGLLAALPTDPSRQSDPFVGLSSSSHPSLPLWHCRWCQKLYLTHPNTPFNQRAEYAPFRPETGTQNPGPFAHPVFLPPGTSTPGHRKPSLTMDMAPHCPSENSLSFPTLLEETTKTKQEPNLFQGECFHPAPTS